jgi:hypothetical protein
MKTIKNKEQIKVRKPGRPPQNLNYTFIKVPDEIHLALKKLAKKEERTIQIISARILRNGLQSTL